VPSFLARKAEFPSAVRPVRPTSTGKARAPRRSGWQAPSIRRRVRHPLVAEPGCRPLVVLTNDSRIDAVLAQGGVRLADALERRAAINVNNVLLAPTTDHAR